MRAVTFNIDVLGPRPRCSVANWMLQSPANVYVGRKNAALKGSGYTQEERDSLTTTVGKFIHFSSRADVDAAIFSFPWVEGCEYNFGYHPTVTHETMIEHFKSRMAYFFRRMDMELSFTRSTHSILTIYLSHYNLSNPDNIECIRRYRYKQMRESVQQCLYIGKSSMWDDLARQATASFAEIVAQTTYRVGAAGAGVDLLPHIENMMMRDDDLRTAWQSKFNSLIWENHTMLNIFQDGARCLLDVPYDLRDLKVGQARLCPGHTEKKRPSDIPLFDLFRGGKIRNKYEMHAGLGRLEVMLAAAQVDAELRFEGSIGVEETTEPDIYDLYETGISHSLICSAHGIMPLLTQTELDMLRDPNKRAYLLCKFSRPLHPCCVDMMMNQMTIHVPQMNPKVISLNPTQPPEFDDERKVAEINGHDYQTDLWPADRLIWCSVGTTDAEVRRVSRFLANKYNQTSVTMEDYTFMQRHPGGVLDHMLRYTVGNETRSLGLEAVKKYVPLKGNMERLVKKARFDV